VFGFLFSVFGFRFSVFGFRFSVFSFQFSVGSGQWAVGEILNHGRHGKGFQLVVGGGFVGSEWNAYGCSAGFVVAAWSDQ
jgi:hypothetical protein